jgi:LytS/YehU family sensor histidine kinase
MDIGEFIYLSSRLFLGALASFFAIMVWSKTRDAAWMLMVMGTLAAYIESVYLILDMFGISGDKIPLIGTISLPLILLSSLCNIFFIAAFLVMVIRKYRKAGSIQTHSNSQFGKNIV